MKSAGMFLAGAAFGVGVCMLVMLWLTRASPIIVHDFESFTRQQLTAAGIQAPNGSYSGGNRDNQWSLDLEGDPAIAARVFYRLRNEVERIVAERATISGRSSGTPPTRFSFNYQRGSSDGVIHCFLIPTTEQRSLIIFILHEAR